MPIPTTPYSLPSFKRYLYHACRDLDDIERNIDWTWGDELSPLEKAVILLEDRRYFTHRGIDWRSAFREFFRKVTFRRHGGASTIEMQFVRTCTGYRELTWGRKLYEMFLAWCLLHRASKLEILRSYLSRAYLGTGLRGVEQAAEGVFHTNVYALNDEHVFQIAAMLVYPRPTNPSDSWNLKIIRRANYAKALLAKIGANALR